MKPFVTITKDQLEAIDLSLDSDDLEQITNTRKSRLKSVRDEAAITQRSSRSERPLLTFGQALNRQISEESDNNVKSQEDSEANTVDKGRAMQERSVFKQGLNIIIDKSDGASLKQDGP